MCNNEAMRQLADWKIRLNAMGAGSARVVEAIEFRKKYRQLDLAGMPLHELQKYVDCIIEQKSGERALVRRNIERVNGVNRTWFEWDWNHEAGVFAKTLVVEVDFNTDPNAQGFDQSALNGIGDAARSTLTDGTTMMLSNLRIVPARP